MNILYDLIGLFVISLHLPVYLLRGKFHKDFSRRLGVIPAGRTFARPIWVHAVSVGEAAAVRGLIDELRRAYPGRPFVISTVTQTGNKIARGFARDGDFVTYLPLDISFIVNHVLKRVNPSLFIIVETEIWPNLINALARLKVPVVTVNGRISDRSFKGYKRVRFLLKSLLRKITRFCVQTETDARRLEHLGVPAERITVTGNLKFDSLKKIDDVQESNRSLRKMLGLHPADIVLVAGSTHRGEEEKILRVYENVREHGCNVQLVIAPRHPERAGSVADIIQRHQFDSVRITSFAGARHPKAGRRRVYLLDTVGQLMDFYAMADIVFVGGSLVKKGGHNILEPASLGKPVIVGPYMHNFRDMAELFLAGKGAFMVRGEEELREKILHFMRYPEEACVAGRTAIEIIRQNTGATRRTIEAIKNILPA